VGSALIGGTASLEDNSAGPTRFQNGKGTWRWPSGTRYIVCSAVCLPTPVETNPAKAPQPGDILSAIFLTPVFI